MKRGRVRRSRSREADALLTCLNLFYFYEGGGVEGGREGGRQGGRVR